MLAPDPLDALRAEMGRRKPPPDPVAIPMPAVYPRPRPAERRLRGLLPAVAALACLGVFVALVFMNHRGHSA